MYKIVALLVFVLIGCVSARTSTFNSQSKSIQLVSTSFKPENNALDWCPECVDGFGQLIDGVLEVVLEYGVLGSCSALCNLVINKTESEFVGVLCLLGCNIYGIKEFVKLIEDADLDPIYYCEVIRLCPVDDNGDAKFTTFVILPTRGQVGTTFNIDYFFKSVNGTGTGEITISIDTVDKLPLSTAFLLEQHKPGTYGQRLSVDASPDPDCDPATSECEEWLPGTYNVTMMICNGQCGSHHPHSQLYDKVNGSFEIYE